jgi:membrane-associated phospholipid phosphatase
VREARRFHLHELALGGFGAGVALLLAVRAGPLHPCTIEVSAATVLLAGVVLLLRRLPSERWQRVRLVAGYPFALWFYALTEPIVPALNLSTRDAALRAVDQAVLGETPAVWLARFATPLRTELLSACYLSYHLYMTSALLLALTRPLERMRQLCERVYAALALGYVGYLCVPAVGPWRAFPELFAGHPLSGGPFEVVTTWLVIKGSSIYDAFPSLHVAIVLVMLGYDARHERWRFALMLPVAAGLVVSTMYLRYHYAVDLVAGAVLALGVHAAFQRLHAAGEPLQ